MQAVTKYLACNILTVTDTIPSPPTAAMSMVEVAHCDTTDFVMDYESVVCENEDKIEATELGIIGNDNGSPVYSENITFLRQS